MDQKAVGVINFQAWAEIRIFPTRSIAKRWLKGLNQKMMDIHAAQNDGQFAPEEGNHSPQLVVSTNNLHTPRVVSASPQLSKMEHALQQLAHVEQVVVLTTGKSMYAYLVADCILDLAAARKKVLHMLPSGIEQLALSQMGHIPLLPNGLVNRDALLTFEQRAHMELISKAQ